MDEPSRCDLPYGHYGRGEYRLKDHKWQFPRLGNAYRTVVSLGSTNTVDASAEPAALKDDFESTGPISKHHEQQVKALVDRHPELCPAANLLKPMLRMSKAVDRAVHHHDPLRHSLLAFSSMRSRTRHQPVPMAAFISGETGSVLRLMRMQTQRHGWSENSGHWLKMPILQGDAICVPIDSGPIQQVVFTQPGQNLEPVVAVRLLTKTQLFRPRYGRAPTITAASSSGLGLDPLHSFDIHDTGGVSHADLSFNPWFSQQIAVIDQAGHWSVFEFDSRQMNRRRLTCSGSIGLQSHPDESGLSDGWARIAWICNVSTLVVCSRRCLTLFNISNGLVKLGNIELHLATNAPWILDFAINPLQKDSCLVLTSTHVLLCRFEVGQAPDEVAQNIPAKMRHYMSPEDLSLRFAMWKEGDNEIGLLLFTSSAVIMTLYRLRLCPGPLFQWDDPTGFDLNASINSSRQSSHVIDVHVHPLGIHSKLRPDTARQQEHRSLISRYYQLTIIRADNSIRQELVCYAPKIEVERPNWQKIPQAVTNSKLRRAAFVIDEREEIDSDGGAKLWNTPRPRRMRPASAEIGPTNPMLDLTSIAKSLSSQRPGSQSLAGLLSEVKDVLANKWTEAYPPIRTTSDLTSSELTIPDLRQASEQLERVLAGSRGEPDMNMQEVDSSDRPRRLKLAKVPLPLVPSFNDQLASADLSIVHDSLVSTWVSPLAARIPGWVRLAKAELVRRVAVELVLAAHAIQVDQTLDAHAEDAEQSSPQTWHLPVRSAEHLTRTAHGSSLAALHSSQVSALPTPSPTVTPSVTTASGSSSYAAPEVHRLSQYTTFAKSAPSVLPRALNNVLAHWKLQDDPAEYDWLSTARGISEQDEDHDEEMNEKERRRMHRRAERHIRRQRREAAASQAQQLASSQAPEIFSASQPALKVESQPLNLAGSSQTQTQNHASSAVTASQIAPGRYGGRPPRKKRKQGF